MTKCKKRTVFGPHSDQTSQVEITLFCNTPDCGKNHVWRGFPAIHGYLLGQKADSFWSAPRSNFSGRNYIILQYPRLRQKPRLARVSSNPWIPVRAKSGQFLVRSAQKIRSFKQVQSAFSEEIVFYDPAPTHLFRSSPDEKSGQFLVRTHVRKNAQIPRIFGGMSGVLKWQKWEIVWCRDSQIS